MGNVPMNRTATTPFESLLAGELARADRALSGIAPVIAHLLDTSGEALVNEAILARLRGMLAHLAQQLLGAGHKPHERTLADTASIDALAEALASDPAVLGHLYAVAVEGLLTERLDQRATLDTVLSPLLQELIASDHPTTAELAMQTLAAQSRFMQGQRRMELALEELPAQLFTAVLARFEAARAGQNADDLRHTMAALRSGYDEGAGRLGLLARLVSGMRGGVVAALSLEHAGVALFASALASCSDQPRDLVVLSCHERQSLRFALTLRAAGLESDAIAREVERLGLVDVVAPGMSSVAPERARAMLAQSGLGDAIHAGVM